MKHLVLTYRDICTINIGDYIQSIAAKQYLDVGKLVYANRDELGLYNGEEAKVIMNGWFTYKPDQWLPSQKIYPLFVAFHLNSEVKDQVLNEETIFYLKQHSPIGCRDTYTVNILKERGIEAYYSGCLTTTIGYNFPVGERNSDILVVDPCPYMPNGNSVLEILIASIQFLFNLSAVLKLLKKYRKDNIFTINISKIGIGRLLLLTKTYLLLKQIFDEELIWKARYITHYHMCDEYKEDEKCFERAEELLRLYSSAKYVVTSRIHCAFPCLGLHTPVAYIHNFMEESKSTCRLSNIHDLLNVVSIRGEKILTNFLGGKFKETTIFTNKDCYLKNRNNLISTCRNFISK